MSKCPNCGGELEESKVQNIVVELNEEEVKDG